MTYAVLILHINNSMHALIYHLLHDLCRTTHELNIVPHYSVFSDYSPPVPHGLHIFAGFMDATHSLVVDRLDNIVYFFSSTICCFVMYTVRTCCEKMLCLVVIIRLGDGGMKSLFLQPSSFCEMNTHPSGSICLKT